MKTLTLTIQEFYEFKLLANLEKAHFSFKRKKETMKIKVSKEFCQKFNY